MENTVLGATYVYSSASEPNQDTGAFRNRHDFVCALLDPKRQREPEMMIYGGDYTSSKDLRLDLIFPVIFPFGTGDPKMRRLVPISLTQCLAMYMRVANPSFRRGDFILVCLHILHRCLSYKTGSMICKLRLGDTDQSVAEQLSVLNPDELSAAAERRTNSSTVSTPADTILKKIVTSCKPMGH